MTSTELNAQPYKVFKRPWGLSYSNVLRHEGSPAKTFLGAANLVSVAETTDRNLNFFRLIRTGHPK